MKKNIFLLIAVLCTSPIYTQNVKLLATYVKPVNGETRFVTVLSDNTIWWADPALVQWNKVATNNLPAKFEIKRFAAYVKPSGDTRYAVVLADNSIWWADPADGNWNNVAATNLPAKVNLRDFSAYVKSNGETRFAVVLDNNTMWWADPGQGNWNEVSLKTMGH